MKMSVGYIAGAVVFLVSAALSNGASAQGMDVPGATAASNSKIKDAWVDKNGDGLIQKDELAPGSQLAKRFETRDANHDGTLTRDEYYY